VILLAEVASAYVTLLPSARGFGAATSRQLSGDLGRVGSQQGKVIGNGIRGSLLGSVGKLAAPLAGAFAALQIGKFVASSIKSEAAFSTVIRQIGVAADVSGAGLESLRQLAIKTGADTVFSAQDAADAELELAKGGISPAVIAGGALKAVMSLAAAGQLELADAAGVTSAAMHTFNIGAKDAGSIADALAGGANASSADVSDLAQALTQVGSGASLAGLNLNETVGVLSALADKGIKGSDAGTSLKTMLQRLTPATTQAAAEMKKLGLNFTDAAGNFLPIDKVAQQLKTHLAGLSESQRNSALQTIFGSDAIRAAAALYGAGAKGIDKYISATEKQGNAQKLADAAMNGTSGALEALSGSFDTAKLAVGTFLAPATILGANLLTSALNKITTALNAIKAPDLTKLSSGFASVFDGIKKNTETGGLDPLNRFMTAAQKAGRVSLKAPAKAPFTPGSGPLTAKGAQTQSQSINTKPAEDSTNKLVALGQRAATALLPVIKGVQSYGLSIVNGFRTLSGPAQAFVAKLIPPLRDFGNQISTTLGPGMAKIGDIITTQFVPALARIMPVLAPVAAFLLGVFLHAVVGALKGALLVVQGVLTAISGILNVFTGIFTLNWTTFWTGIKQIVSGVLHTIGGLIELAWNVGIIKVFRLGFAAIRGATSAGWAGIEALFSGGFRTITALPRVAWAGIKAVFRDGISATVSVIRNGASTYVRVFSAGVRGLVSAARSSISSVIAVVRGLPGRIKGALGDLGGLLVSAGRALIEGLARGMISALGSVARAAGSVASKIKSFFPGSPVKNGPLRAWNNGATGRKLVEFLAEGIRKATPSAVKEIKSLATKLGAEYDKATSSLQAKITEKNNAVSQIVTSTQLGDITSLITPTSKEITKVMSTQLAKVRKFSADLKKLIKLGLNKTTIKQLSDAGVDAGGKTADAILKGGKGSVKSVNKLQSQLNKASKGLGNTVANDLYGAGVKAAQGLVDGLNSQAKALQKIANHLGKKIATEVKKELGIHSPSRVMHDVGTNTVAGLIGGLGQGEHKLGLASRNLAAVIPKQASLTSRAPTFALADGTGTSGSGASSISFGDVYAFTPDSLVKQLDERQKRLDALAFAG
jgi:TP901 family phage tail tape measure protein